VQILRNIMAWIFAIECFFFSSVVWITHYPPQYREPFILGGDASPFLTIVEVCAFYFVVIFALGVAWWTTWKAKASSRIWGITASIVSLFWYQDPSYWYQIHRRGVWVHWAICLLGLIAFIAPQSERPPTNARRDRLGGDLPNAGICYAWGVVFPVVYLFTRPRNRQNAFLRFHAVSARSCAEGQRRHLSPPDRSRCRRPARGTHPMTRLRSAERPFYQKTTCRTRKDRSGQPTTTQELKSSSCHFFQERGSA
jgi:hypothetical protein